MIARSILRNLIPDYYYTGSVPIDFDLHSETGSCLVSFVVRREVVRAVQERVGCAG